MIGRRHFLTRSAALLGMVLVPRQRPGRRPVPSAAQLLWQRDELALFLHFGVNTFSDREWGDGRESPASFAPILTAKHHDGFCLWPTGTTRHSVAASPWREGRGDLVREFTDSCQAEGLRAGVYCSPWDRNAPSYGDSARYNDLFCDQLTELLTRYGPIHEVWFDGANGEGPNGKRQVYDWPRFFSLVKRLQPDSVIFSDAGPDVRWIGNERGIAGDPNWSTVDPGAVPYPGASGDHVTRALQHGDPAGSVWRPGESDVSIRPGWFYHPLEDSRAKSAEDLVELYFSSVGRNSKLLLNVPPTREGLLHPVDVNRLAGMRRALSDRFDRDLARNHPLDWRALDRRTATAELSFDRPVQVSVSSLSEAIERGQRVARYRLDGLSDGRWQTLARGSTIGYRKLDRFPSRIVERVRVVIEDAVDTVEPVTLSLYRG